MNTIKKECQVVLLPTKKDSPISYEVDWLRLKFIGDLNNGYLNTSTQQNFHLYILSDDKPIAGDWIYWNGKIVKAIDTVYTKSTKKIIATTDQTLEMKKDVVGGFETGIAFPQPSPSFIQKYIESYNNGKPIEKVMVEYLKHFDEDWSEISGAFEIEYETLKINSKDNTIFISNIKDSWSKEELKEIFVDLVDAVLINATKPTTLTNPENLNKWIEENL